MAASEVPPAGLENIFLPAVVQSILSEICCRAVISLVESSCFREGGSSKSTITCNHFLAETRPCDINAKVVEECNASRQDADIDEVEGDSSEKCRINILLGAAVPELGFRVPRQLFSEWLLAARNEGDEDENDDEDDDDDEDEDDEGGDEEEGNDEDGGDAEGEDGDGDEEEEEDDADEDEDEDEEEEDEDDDEDDESPPKKARK